MTVLVLLVSSCNVQRKSDLIIGDWTCVKGTTVTGRDTLSNGIEFTSDKFINKSSRPTIASPVAYLVQGDFVVSNGRKRFYIEKVTDDELILVWYDLVAGDPFTFIFKNGHQIL